DELTLAAFGTVGLGLHTVDRYDANGAKCGVRSIELFVDSVPVFSTRFEDLDFGVNRYCNAHMDYEQFKGNKLEYHRCYRLPNNKLRIYGKEEAQGRIDLEPGAVKHIRFLITDANGNSSALTFNLLGATEAEAAVWPKAEEDGSLFRYDAANTIKEVGLHFELPANALYDDAFVKYSSKPGSARMLSAIHTIGDPLTPIHAAGELRIAIQSTKPTKAVVVKMNADGTSNGTVGGKYADGWITTSIKNFGAYTVMLDTTPPVITNQDLRANMSGRKSFSLKVSDNLSGMTSWSASLDGEWIVMEYDPKTKLLTHHFDKHTNAPGKKEFKLTVTDERGNSSRYVLTFSH
ncbi:MAG TPA: hypothetical protein PK760_01390, partial [Flavobacteriales bacterium]|nr:hypothetical protein [Flavobacteriales bacterium]